MPRSGTTWVARVLAASLATEILDEPDNHFVSPYAFRVKRELEQGNYPEFTVGDRAPAYERLWRRAFALEVGPSGPARRARRTLSRRLLRRERPEHVTRVLIGRDAASPGLRLAGLMAVPEQPSPDLPAIVVKSVHACLSAEWVVSLCSPSVVAVIRDPLNVLSSWLELGWLGEDVLETIAPALRRDLARRYGVPSPSEDWTEIQKGAWVCAALTRAVADLGRKHVVVRHEELYRDPRVRFRAIADRLGMPWSAGGERLLEDLDRPGRGYETARVAKDLEEVWRSRLSAEQAGQALEVLRHFPLETPSAPVESGDDR